MDNLNFRGWCQKVLPLVYDDSLSYYELLCKMIKYINDAIDIGNINAKDMKELKEYVDNFFDNLDVTSEVNAKLDAMAADGTLDNLINKVLFGELDAEIEEIRNWNETPEDLANFRRDAIGVAASYLMTVYNSSCVEGNLNANKVCWEYNTDKGYMGIMGRYAGFVWTDTEDTPNGTLPVAYADCSVMLSLLTKCRPYANSPYAYAFSNKDNVKKSQLFNLSLEYGTFDSKPYTFDWLNQLNTGAMSLMFYKAGIPVVQVSSRTGENVPVYSHIDTLETGDIIWRGNNVAETRYGASTYKGIDHSGMFVKSLDELNNAIGVPSGVTFKEVTGQTSDIGYIIEFSGSQDDTKYKDCLRITAFEKWANYQAATYENIVWQNTKIFASKPISNVLTSNKAQMRAKNILSCYDYECIVRQELDSNGNPVVCEVIPRIAGGLVIQENDDLNDYTFNGVYQCNTVSVLNSLLNKPNIGTSFTLICIGFNVGRNYGQQIIIADRGTTNQVFIRSCTTVWSKWQKVVLTASDNNNTGVREFDSGSSGVVDLPANSYKDVEITYDKEFSAAPYPVAILSTQGSANGYGSTAIIVRSRTETGCTFRVFNNSATALQVFLLWCAFAE